MGLPERMLPFRTKARKSPFPDSWLEPNNCVVEAKDLCPTTSRRTGEGTSVNVGFFNLVIVDRISNVMLWGFFPLSYTLDTVMPILSDYNMDGC